MEGLEDFSMNTASRVQGVPARPLISRRRFLGAALAAPSIVPAALLGRDGGIAPSERITVGCIGVGIITCCPFGLHMARSVGSQERLNSSA